MNLYEYQSQGHSLTLVQGHSDLMFTNFFSLETTGPVEAKFYVAPPLDLKTKVCSNSPSYDQDGRHAHISSKNLRKKIFLSGTKKLTLKFGMQHLLPSLFK